MKIILSFVCVALLVGSAPPQEGNVEFVCIKTHKASNTCYFNFKVDGGKYTYIDVGCKKTKKKDDTIQKVKEGKLALSRDWRIECPESGK